MTRLSSNPQLLWKSTLPFVYWDNFFSESDLQNIERYYGLAGVEKSKIVSSNTTEISDSIRNSEIKLHYVNKDNEWLFDKLLIVAGLINDRFYRFDLLGFDHFQYTEYNGPGTMYDYHTDMVFGENVPVGLEICRKLSFSLILSDTHEYQGGDFEIKLTSRPSDKLEQKRGRIIAFPSYILHKVTPIISGSRRSIVFWAVGPKFK
jgi:PKHD-type hydroxylase